MLNHILPTRIHVSFFRIGAEQMERPSFVTAAEKGL
uniref:Uncharacterized protein n=1 Tax=Arundo donax TaxID=35708 RepID=A0A0A8ZLR6_ARUDO